MKALSLGSGTRPKTYWGMSRTNIDIDDACAVVMARYQLKTKRKAVNLALNTLAAAIEARIPILHANIDFDVLARHTPLQVVIP